MIQTRYHWQPQKTSQELYDKYQIHGQSCISVYIFHVLGVGTKHFFQLPSNTLNPHPIWYRKPEMTWEHDCIVILFICALSCAWQETLQIRLKKIMKKHGYSFLKTTQYTIFITNLGTFHCCGFVQLISRNILAPFMMVFQTLKYKPQTTFCEKRGLRLISAQPLYQIAK